MSCESVALSGDAFVEAAMDQTGLDDFGPTSYREGLDLYCESVSADAQLNAIGAGAIPGAIVSALANLLDNAIKYSDPGTDVTVAAVVRGETIELSVADHGIGIPARDLERVFERFYRVDQARSRQTGGTGLGLAIVRHVAVNHHGRVEVASRTGEGSTFTLRLPAAPPDPTTGSDTSSPTTRAPGRPAPVPTPIGRQAGR